MPRFSMLIFYLLSLSLQNLNSVSIHILSLLGGQPKNAGKKSDNRIEHILVQFFINSLYYSWDYISLLLMIGIIFCNNIILYAIFYENHSKSYAKMYRLTSAAYNFIYYFISYLFALSPRISLFICLTYHLLYIFAFPRSSSLAGIWIVFSVTW